MHKGWLPALKPTNESGRPAAEEMELPLEPPKKMRVVWLSRPALTKVVKQNDIYLLLWVHPGLLKCPIMSTGLVLRSIWQKVVRPWEPKGLSLVALLNRLTFCWRSKNSWTRMREVRRWVGWRQRCWSRLKRGDKGVVGRCKRLKWSRVVCSRIPLLKADCNSLQ